MGVSIPRLPIATRWLMVLSAFAAYAAALRDSPTAATRNVVTVDAGAEYVLKVDDRAATFLISALTKSAVEAAPGSLLSTQLYPSYAAAPGDYLPSVEMVSWKGTRAESGAVAAAIAAWDGNAGPAPAGKIAFLSAVLAKLKASYDADDRPSLRASLMEAMSFLATAVMLLQADGKLPANLALPADVVANAEKAKAEFLDADAAARAPAGLGSWGEDTHRAYLAHAWLAQPFKRVDENRFSAAVALAWAVYGDAALAGRFSDVEKALLSIGGRSPGTASPRDYFNLLGGREAPTVLKEVGTVDAMRESAKTMGEAFVFLPAVDDADILVFKRFVGGTGAAEAALTALKNDAQFPAMPGPSSSWADYRYFALAALARPDKTPEARKLTWDDGYRKRLEEGFRFGFDQTRGRAAVPPSPLAPGETLVVEVRPDLRLEPLPEYYLRLARGCARLEKALAEMITPEKAAALRGKRESGAPPGTPLLEELAAASAFYYGCYLLSCADLGIQPTLTSGDAVDRAAAAAAANEWLGAWRNDADMKGDVREAYPLGPADAAAPEKGTLYRCVLGVRALDVEAKYEKKPAFSLVGSNRKADLHFKPAKITVLAPVVVDVVVAGEKPLTREAFRKLCDENKTRTAIVAALDAFGKEPAAPPPPKTAGEEKPKVDRGIIILVVVLGVFALIVVIALVAGRPRDYYS